MDKVVSILVGLGVPGLILAVAIGVSGYFGAAALTVALSAIGPGGMVGGVVTLALIGIVSEGIAEYGFDKIFVAVVKELCKKGESKESLIEKIKKYPITKGLKQQVIFEINNLQI